MGSHEANNAAQVRIATANLLARAAKILAGVKQHVDVDEANALSLALATIQTIQDRYKPAGAPA